MTLNLFRPREKFLVLEISLRGTRGTFIAVDEDRRIVIEKQTKNIDPKKLARNIFQKSWEGKRLFESSRRVIAAADPTIATTIPIPLDLAREHTNEKQKITLPELENLIAQAMAKIFNGCRAEAARRLGADELDAILVGLNAKHFAADGRAVESPVGFRGRRISLLLEFTFTRRDLFEALKPFWSAPGGFFFVEAPQVRLLAFSRVRTLPLNLIVADDRGTSLFVLEKAKGEYAVLYRERLDWTVASLFQCLAEEFKVSEKIAQELYRAFRRGRLSEAARRVFAKTIQPAVEKFFEEADKAKIRGFVYVDAAHEFPLDLPHKRGAAVIERHPTGEILEKLGFTADLQRFGAGADAAARPILYLLEAYFDKSGSDINRKLRRRLHWLAD